MASVYRKTRTILVPEGAEVLTRNGRQHARWTDGMGKKQTSLLSHDGTRVHLKAKVWMARGSS